MLRDYMLRDSLMIDRSAYTEDWPLPVHAQQHSQSVRVLRVSAFVQEPVTVYSHVWMSREARVHLWDVILFSSRLRE